MRSVLVLLAACWLPHVDEQRRTGPCAITVDAPHPLAIPEQLAALGPQYFHPAARDVGFNNLIIGGTRYEWFDPTDLDEPITPPTGMNMIWFSTRSFLLGSTDRDIMMMIARRGDKTATRLPLKTPFPTAFVEDATGTGWVLVTGDVNSRADLAVVRIDRTLASTEIPITKVESDAAFDRKVAVTQAGRVAVVWPEMTDDGIGLVMAWSTARGGFGAPIVVDHVQLDANAAALSIRTGLDIRVTPEGANALAVAWRPLAPKAGERADLGTESNPPAHGVSADVRVLVVDPRAQAIRRNVYPSFAVELGETSGIGPWPLYGNGMVATSLAGHAVFFWNDRENVVYATTREAPRAITDGNFRLLPRRTNAGAEELLLLKPDGEQHVASIECR